MAKKPSFSHLCYPTIKWTMALETFVKVSNVNNLSDARYCAGMGVDVVGFNLSPHSPDFISVEKFGQITEWLSGVEFAGEFEGLSAPEIHQLALSYPIQYIQVQDPSLLKGLSQQPIPLIFKVDMDKIADLSEVGPLLQQHHHQVSMFLFEGKQEEYDKDVLSEIISLSEEYPVLLGYGITSSNVSELVHHTAIKGISLLGEEEIRTGYKDFDKLAEILEQLEVDEFED